MIEIVAKDGKALPPSVTEGFARFMAREAKVAAEALEVAASAVEPIDPAFAATCRDKAANYRT